MPPSFIPIAIIVAKVGASAIVSLAPVAMRRKKSSKSEPDFNRRKIQDFFDKEFYSREFDRLANERIDNESRKSSARELSSLKSEL
jgi:hypothetical protein